MVLLRTDVERRVYGAASLTVVMGAVGGRVLTGGSAAGTIGGAAIGGVIGHEVDKKK